MKIDKWEFSVVSWALAIQDIGCNCICWLNTEWIENGTFHLENKQKKPWIDLFE